MTKPHFNPGTSVRVINYGFIGYSKTGLRDLYPDIIGMDGVIYYVKKFGDEWRYLVKGIPIRAGWYREDQLEELF